MASGFGLSALVFGALAMQNANVTVGVGLDLKQGVLVQEYWEGGSPFYAIANLRKTPAKVAIDAWENRRVGERLIGPVDVGPGELVRVNAAAAEGNRELVAVTLDATVLGLLHAPRKPPAPQDGKITSYDGLNGVGARRTDLWLTQDEPAYPPGAEVTLRLTVPDGIGTIYFAGRQSLTSHPEATLRGVTSDSLPVREVEGGFTIDATRAKQARKSHVVVLQIQTPRADPPPMFTLNGRVTTPYGGGFSITRGIPLAVPAHPK